ncbi:MAG: hypothetical protein K2X72_23160 [Reyranella sp.]|nr:hypothetical protein [Reyranella sp.]
MADAGWISPLYHGNEAETDLKPVGDVELNAGFDVLPAVGKFALALPMQMQVNQR